MLPSNGHQESLFEPKELNRLPEGVGYRGAVACSAAGIDIPAEEEDELDKFREFLDQVKPEDFNLWESLNLNL